MSVYNKNLQVLKEKDKVLYQAVLDWNEPMRDQCFVQETRNGSQILGIKQDGKDYYMGSRYNPEKEAERFAEQYHSLVNESYMIYLGLGDEKLLKVQRKHMFDFYAAQWYGGCGFKCHP